MIISVNFVSKEYKNKVMNEKFAKIGIFAAVVVFAAIIGGMFYMDMMIKSAQAEIAAKETEIGKLDGEISEVKRKIAEVPDLSDKVNMLNDLFAQSNLRFSEILLNLMKNTPNSVWFNDFTYKDNNIALRGISMSEISAFEMERNLKDTGFFTTVMQDYIRDVEINKNKVKEFQYNCVLKDLRQLANNTSTPAGTTTAAVAAK